MEQERDIKRRKLESERDVHPQPRELQSSWSGLNSTDLTHQGLPVPNEGDFNTELQVPSIQTILGGPFPPNGVSNTFWPVRPRLVEGQNLLGCENGVYDNRAITYDSDLDMDTDWAILPPIWTTNYGEQHVSGDPPQNNTQGQQCPNPHADWLDESPDWNPNEVAVTETGWVSGTSQDLFSPTVEPQTSATSPNGESTPWITPRQVFGTPAPGSSPSLITGSDQQFLTSAGGTPSSISGFDMRGSSQGLNSDSDGALANPIRDDDSEDSELLCFGMVKQRDFLVQARAYKRRFANLERGCRTTSK